MSELTWPNIPIVSAIIERMGKNGQKEVLVQTRWKPGVSEYSWTMEIPAGWIERYENVYDALKREVQEETGLNIIKFTPDICTSVHSISGDGAFAFKSFCCQQQLKWGLPWMGFVFICEVEEGELKSQESESRDVRWISISDLAQLVYHERTKIFILQIGPLELYLKENGYFWS